MKVGFIAAGVIENSDTFEPGVMTPEMVGAKREFVLGKHTGTHSVRKRLEESGFAPTDEEVRTVTRQIKDYGAEKERVTVDVLTRFARENNIDRERTARSDTDDDGHDGDGSNNTDTTDSDSESTPDTDPDHGEVRI